MNDRAVRLACEALYEHLTKNMLTDKAGQAVTAFLRFMESRNPVPPAPQSPAEAEQPMPAPQHTPETGQLLREREAAEREAATWRKKHDQADADLNRLKTQHENEKARWQSDLEQALRKAHDAETSLAAARQCHVPEQESLGEIQAFLAALPQETAHLLSPYFATDSLITFLVQCGQFNRLNQLWEACGKAVTAGRATPGMTQCLEKLLALYNRAAGENLATTVAPTPGNAYNSEIHYRVNSDGRTVRTLLLPGLRNPGGKLQQKALVELR